MAAGSSGNCYLCGVELGKTAMKNHLLKAHGEPNSEQACVLLKIEGAYNKDYWLYIDIPADKPLSVVDTFLRKIWGIASITLLRLQSVLIVWSLIISI